MRLNPGWRRAEAVARGRARARPRPEETPGQRAHSSWDTGPTHQGVTGQLGRYSCRHIGILGAARARLLNQSQGQAW